MVQKHFSMEKVSLKITLKLQYIVKFLYEEGRGRLLHDRGPATLNNFGPKTLHVRNLGIMFCCKTIRCYQNVAKLKILSLFIKERHVFALVFESRALLHYLAWDCIKHQ